MLLYLYFVQEKAGSLQQASEEYLSGISSINNLFYNHRCIESLKIIQFLN